MKQKFELSFKTQLCNRFYDKQKNLINFYNNQPASTTKQTTTNTSKNLEVKIHEILAEKSSQVDVRKIPREVKQWCNGPPKIVNPPGPLTALKLMPGSGKC